MYPVTCLDKLELAAGISCRSPQSEVGRRIRVGGARRGSLWLPVVLRRRDMPDEEFSEDIQSCRDLTVHEVPYMQPTELLHNSVDPPGERYLPPHDERSPGPDYCMTYHVIPGVGARGPLWPHPLNKAAGHEEKVGLALEEPEPKKVQGRAQGWKAIAKSRSVSKRLFNRYLSRPANSQTQDVSRRMTSQ
eukprot:scaffold3202_cov407-Prasinococcus_capsulatus_cf.AAC.10